MPFLADLRCFLGILIVAGVPIKVQLIIEGLAEQGIEMASVSGEYEEDWETEPSINKKNLVSTTDRHFPGENDERNATRDVELTQHEDDLPDSSPTMVPEPKFKALDVDLTTVGIKTKVENTVAATTQEEVSTSEDTQSSDDNVVASRAPEQTYPRTSDLRDMVSIHGRRYDRPIPPPIPVNVSLAEVSLSPSKLDIGALQSRVAAKRVVEFQRRQELKASEERDKELGWIRKCREIRRSNEQMHQALGVAGLSVQDHLRLARRQHKQDMKMKEIAASSERQNRWYNSISKRPQAAPNHVRKLQLQYNQEKREMALRIQRRQKTIQANQLELRQKAQAIIAKTSGAYVHGSYLLKVEHHAMKQQNYPPSSDQHDIMPDENGNAIE